MNLYEILHVSQDAPDEIIKLALICCTKIS